MSIFFDAPAEGWTYCADNVEQEFYPGHSALVAYLQEHEIWSYSEFLTLHQDIIVNALPFSTKWNGLDGIWTKRFLKVAKELDSNAFEDLKNKSGAALAQVMVGKHSWSVAALDPPLQRHIFLLAQFSSLFATCISLIFLILHELSQQMVSERSTNSLKAYWEEVICRKTQLAKAVKSRLSTVTPTSKRVSNKREDLDAGAENEREEGEDDEVQSTEKYPGREVLVAYLKGINANRWSYIDFLQSNRAAIVNLTPISCKWNTLDSVWTRRFLQEGNEIGSASADVMKKKIKLERSKSSRLIKTFFEDVIDKQMTLDLERTFDRNDCELLKKSGNFHTRKLSLHYDRGAEDILKSERTPLSDLTNEKVTAEGFSSKNAGPGGAERETGRKPLGRINVSMEKRDENEEDVDVTLINANGLRLKRNKFERIVLSDRTNTSESSVIATQPLSITDIKEWSTEQLTRHLQTKFLDDLDDEDLEILRKGKIRGRAFQMLTKEELMADGMKRGPASVIADYINKLKNERPLKRVRTTGLRGSASEDEDSLQEPTQPLKAHNSDQFYNKSKETDKCLGAHAAYNSNRDNPVRLVIPTTESADKLAFISNDRLASFDQWMTKNPFSLLRSPPASGKTTLASLLQQYLTSLGRTVVHISMLSMQELITDMDAVAFDAFWKFHAGLTWTDCTTCESPINVLIDEAQILYGGVSFFWTALKRLMNPRFTNPYLRVLLSMYGDAGVVTDTISTATPIEFSATLGLDDLRMTRDEYDQLVTKFIEASVFPILIPSKVCDAIFSATHGHAGIIRRMLDFLGGQYRRGLRRQNEMLRYLVSPGFRNAIENTRAFNWLREWKPAREEVLFLRQALYEMDFESTFPENAADTTTVDIITRFKRSGLVTHSGPPDSGRLQFGAPLMRIVIAQRLFSMPLSLRNQPRMSDFNDFLLCTIERMRPSILRRSLSRGNGDSARLLERSWQMEWYRAATTAVPYGVIISPDVGHVFGNGQYANIPLKAWAVVDFRHISKVLNPAANIWYAMYNEDFNVITIRRQGKSDVILELRGDQTWPRDNEEGPDEF
ncbi:10516_t:CDS:10, partial [Ambispora leptoticha]